MAKPAPGRMTIDLEDEIHAPAERRGGAAVPVSERIDKQMTFLEFIRKNSIQPKVHFAMVAVATSMLAVAGCGGNDGTSVVPPDGGQIDGEGDGGPEPDAGDPDAGHPPQQTVASPEFAPPQGTFVGPQDVTITSTTAGATIRYTLDGTTPDATSPIYTAPVGIAKTMTLRAIAQKAGAKDSEVRTGSYVIEISQGNAGAVQFDHGTGSYSNDVSVKLSSDTADAALCYTMDDRAPSCQLDGTEARCGGNSLRYGDPVQVSAAGTQIRAMACKTGLHPSVERSAIYTLIAARPTFDPAPGSYDPAKPVPITLSTETKGGWIHYTRTGTEPTCENGETIFETGTLPAITRDTVVKAITCKDKYVISSTATASYLGEVCVGSFEASEPAQLQALARCKQITGSLTIGGSLIHDLSALGRLESVDGDLFVTSTTARSLHGLEKLATVGGTLRVAGNPGLTQLDALSALLAVGRQLSISNNAISEWIGPAGLQKLGALSIREEPRLKRLAGFAGLTEIREGLLIERNASLATIDAMPVLSTLVGGARFDYNNALESVTGFGNVWSVRGDLSVLSNPSLVRFEAFSTAMDVRGALTIEEDPKLAQFALPKVGTIEGPLSLKGDLRALTSLAGLSGLTNAKHVIFDGQFGFTNLQGLEQLTSVTDMLSLTNAQGIVDLSGLNHLKSAGAIWIYNNPQLQSLRGLDKLEKLTRTNGTALHIHSNDALSEIGSLDALTSVAGGINMADNRKLQRLNGLRAVTKIGKELVIYQSPLLTSLAELSSLTSVGDVLSIFECDALPNLSGLGSLQSIGDSLTIARNKSLTKVDDLARLAALGGSFNVTENATLPTCQPTRLVDRLRAGGYRGSVDIHANGGTGTCEGGP